jgi:hypothetical protein
VQGSRPEDHQTRGGYLADEVRYIQCRAAEHDGRFVTVGSLALFSTDAGDALLLDPEDHLAARLARDGDPERRSISRKPKRGSPSAGKVNTESMATLLSTWIGIPAASSLSLAIPSARLRNGVDRKFQICLARVHIRKDLRPRFSIGTTRG